MRPRRSLQLALCLVLLCAGLVAQSDNALERNAFDASTDAEQDAQDQADTALELALDRMDGQVVAWHGPEHPVLLADWIEITVPLPWEDAEPLQRKYLRESTVVQLLVDEEAPVQVRPGYLDLDAAGRPVARVPLRPIREGALDLLERVLMVGDATAQLAPGSVDVVLDLPDHAVRRVSTEVLTPVELPMPVVDIRLWLAGLLVALALLTLVLIRISRTRPPPPEYVPPPELVAIKALERLRGHLPRTQDAVPVFVDDVSDVLRHYVEARFELAAPELTTEEFLVALAARHDGLSERGEALAQFLGLCDLVKFAAHRPDPEGVADLLDVAEDFVEDTRGLVDVPQDGPDTSEASNGIGETEQRAGEDEQRPAFDDGDEDARFRPPLDVGPQALSGAPQEQEP